MTFRFVSFQNGRLESRHGQLGEKSNFWRSKPVGRVLSRFSASSFKVKGTKPGSNALVKAISSAFFFTRSFKFDRLNFVFSPLDFDSSSFARSSLVSDDHRYCCSVASALRLSI